MSDTDIRSALKMDATTETRRLAPTKRIHLLVEIIRHIKSTGQPFHMQSDRTPLQIARPAPD